MGQREERWNGTDQPDFRVLSTRIRGYDALQFRASRRNAHADHPRAADSLRPPGICRKRERGGKA